MTTIVHDLKNALASQEETGRLDEGLFDLLSAACKACCTEYTGGNESCPPASEMEIKSKS